MSMVKAAEYLAEAEERMTQARSAFYAGDNKLAQELRLEAEGYYIAAEIAARTDDADNT
jgi:hypothetical protein